ncbi:MAG TPA: DUF3298 and DUF4163 domain-containing protein [Arenibacter sp.]|nr:DUF3298 and DUF4163 domain-containing protein [Arenibacter sp.]
MKTFFPCFLFLIAIWGCKNEGQLAFEPQEIKSESCGDCPQVIINIPKAQGNDPLSAAINNAIKEEVLSLLIYDDQMEANTIEEAILSFKNGYLELKKLYPDEPIGWEAKIDGVLTYEDKNVLTIQMDSYSFTGGAHGFSTTRFLNFDKNKALEIEIGELFIDSLAFQDFAEAKFRDQENIPATESINSTGFMFENDVFYLPRNIGFTDDGLLLVYERYEVASYADGPIRLTLPYPEIGRFLKLKVPS